jgi:hypothetical protein
LLGASAGRFWPWAFWAHTYREALHGPFRWRSPVNRTTVRIAMAAWLIGLGWAAGRAQTTQPDFELVVDAPVGATSVECVRGCDLAFVERGLNPNSKAMPTFKFNCKGVERCSSYKIGGWIRR